MQITQNIYIKVQFHRNSGSYLAFVSIQFPDLFAPYIKFCTDEADCLVYLREQTKVNEMLSFFVEVRRRRCHLVCSPVKALYTYLACLSNKHNWLTNNIIL